MVTKMSVIKTPVYKNNGYGKLHCLCKVYTNTQTLNSESRLVSSSLIYLCELSRFTSEEQSEECAFSGHAVFSRLGGAKIDNLLLLQGEKEFFFVKMLAEWGNVCIFAAREPAKPLCNA